MNSCWRLGLIYFVKNIKEKGKKKRSYFIFGLDLFLAKSSFVLGLIKKPFLRELENFDFSEMDTTWVFEITKVYCFGGFEIVGFEDKK